MNEDPQFESTVTGWLSQVAARRAYAKAQAERLHEQVNEWLAGQAGSPVATCEALLAALRDLASAR